jgi:hypothetical protein
MAAIRNNYEHNMLSTSALRVQLERQSARLYCKNTGSGDMGEAWYGRSTHQTYARIMLSTSNLRVTMQAHIRHRQMAIHSGGLALKPVC